MSIWEHGNKTLRSYGNEPNENSGCRDKKVSTPQANQEVTKMSKETTSNKPVKTIRAGQVNASIWAKEIETKGKTITIHNVKLCKSYTEDDGKTWKETNSYNVNDLMKAVYCLTKAYYWLITQGKIEDDD
jgi:hypothetical protein